MPGKASKLPRKAPQQRRSQQTVAAILEATARILVEQGYEPLNTNRVAELAGVSVGSLYQYFPNKQALVLALAEKHFGEQIHRIAMLAKELEKLPLRDANKLFIRALMESTKINSALHRALFTEVGHLGEPVLRQLQEQAEQAVLEALRRRRHEILPKDLELAAFFLVSAVDSIILRTLTLAQDRFDMAQLETELSALVMRYLLGE